MEELKFSILTCVYGNFLQFKNFLSTAILQEHLSYEIIIVDNAHPNNDICDVCSICTDYDVGVPIRYLRINEENKKCKNIAQGINLAAATAKGKYLVIVADPNVLLSFNLLKRIDHIDENSVMLSDISGDLKISPTGTYQDEYSNGDAAVMANINASILKEMGWPADPLKLKLIPGKHRMAPPHLAYDVYITALSKGNFLKFGGYDEGQKSWGIYHELFVRNLASKLKLEFIKGIRVIHQYHRVYKDGSV